MKKWFGSGMLLLAAIIWGVAFVAQSVGMDYVGPFTFNYARYFIGALVLLPFILIKYTIPKKNREDGKTATEPEHKKKHVLYTITGGALCGVLLFVASMLQQFGILYSEIVGKAGFLTALYIILVPVLGLFFGKKVKALIWVCVGLAATGLYLLCMTEGFIPELGDILLLLCALVFSFHIMLIDKVSPGHDGVVISCVQFAVAGILCFICAMIWEKWDFNALLQAYIPILYTGALSCGIGYTFQILGQKHVEPTRASLILCLESVVSVLAGWLLLPNQELSLREILGCVIMFAGIVLAQFVRKEEAGAERKRTEA